MKTMTLINRHLFSGLMLLVASTSLLLLPLDMLRAAASPVSQEIGQIVFVSGEVVIERTETRAQNLSPKDIIYNGDIIKTGQNGRIQIRFIDNSFMSIVPDSKFTIKDYSYGDGKDKEKGYFFLFKGGLRVLSGVLRKDRYEFGTAAGTIGLRGTWFNLQISDTNKLTVNVGFDPKDPTGVIITTDAGSLIVERGQTASVDNKNSVPELVEQTTNTASSKASPPKLTPSTDPKSKPKPKTKPKSKSNSQSKSKHATKQTKTVPARKNVNENRPHVFFWEGPRIEEEDMDDDANSAYTSDGGNQ